MEQVNKERAKKTAEGSSLSNDSSLFYNDKLKFEYTEDTKSYHVVSGYPKMIGGEGSALTADAKGVYTIGDYAHQSEVTAEIQYAVNEYPLTVKYGTNGTNGTDKKGGTVSTSNGTSNIKYGQTYTLTVTPEQV